MSKLLESMIEVTKFRDLVAEHAGCPSLKVEIDFDVECGGFFMVDMRYSSHQSYCNEDMQTFCQQHNVHGLMTCDLVEGRRRVTLTFSPKQE